MRLGIFPYRCSGELSGGRNTSRAEQISLGPPSPPPIEPSAYRTLCSQTLCSQNPLLTEPSTHQKKPMKRRSRAKLSLPSRRNVCVQRLSSDHNGRRGNTDKIYTLSSCTNSKGYGSVPLPFVLGSSLQEGFMVPL